MDRRLIPLAFAAIVSGCGTPNGTRVVDGFVLGPLVRCSPPVDVDAKALDASCAGFSRRAIAALDAREPGHAAIVSTETYADGRQVASSGISVDVFVFKLADGSTKATAVACSGEPPVCVGVGAYPR